MTQRNRISFQTICIKIVKLLGFSSKLHSDAARMSTATYSFISNLSISNLSISNLWKFTCLLLCVLASQNSVAQEFDYSLPTGPRYLPGEDRPETYEGRSVYNTSNKVLTESANFFAGQNASPSLFQSTGDGIYQFLEHPVDVIKNASFGALSAGLEAVGALGALEDSIAYVKEKTQYDFGDCAQASVTQQFQLQSCLSDDAALSLQSDYELEKMEIKLRWSF